MTQLDALAILKTGANVFLTGEPGSGKTYTINQYIAHLQNCGIDPSVTASTGIAATHIGGMTIHAWSGIGIRNSISDMDLEILSANEPLTKRLNRASVLIIDEVSMLSAHMLDSVDLVCRTLRRRQEPFGGLQIILVGDFFQLPPISRDSGMNAFAFRARVWKDARFVTCYLSEQHRQSDDSFVSILNAMRSGDFDEMHYELLQSRMSADLPTGSVTQLYTHNADVDRVNEQELAKVSGKSKLYSMTTSGSKSAVQSLQKGCLSPEVLILKQGAVVMCTKNNSIVGYMNGTLGTVTGFIPDTGYPIITTHAQEIITIEPVEWVMESDGKIRARITQIPLRLAWAITVHKSQGMSMDAARIDLSSAFEYGQGYVALSRVRSLDGLYLVGMNETATRVHPEVAAVDSMFRERSKHAVHTFSSLPEPELLQMHQRFISAVGGVWPKDGEKNIQQKKKSAKTAKGTTFDETKRMIESGMLVSDIAKERGLTTGTIFGHIEKLYDAGVLTGPDAKKAIGETDNLAEIIQYMKSEDVSSLSAVKALFDDRYSYDEIRIASLLAKLGE
jgi:hypothetical protein